MDASSGSGEDRQDLEPDATIAPGAPVDGSGGEVSAELAVFVYGTLLEGVENHAYFCRGATAVLPAWAWGRLYMWAPNIPILEVPEAQVLLRGSATLDRDLSEAASWSGGAEQAPSIRLAPSRGWRRIRGQLILFPDPERRLKILDAYEGFRPRTPDYYERVLVPVLVRATDWQVEHVRAAWAYVLPQDADRPDELLSCDAWQPRRD